MKKNYLLYILLLLSYFTPTILKAEEIIKMRKESSGIYTLPCEVNGLKLRFIFDTGASLVSISLTEASFMLKNGYLTDSDIIGTTNIQTADGKIAENYTIKLNTLKIGSVTLRNVEAVVSNGLDAPLLLGQTALDKLGQWSINDSHLILNNYPSEDETKYSWEQIESMLKTGDKDKDKDKAIHILRQLIKDNNDYAAELFLKNISPDTRPHADLIDDNGVTKAIEILTNLDVPDTNDLFHNYRCVIWFLMYRVGDFSLALDFFRKCENAKRLSLEECDLLADDIMLRMCWSEDFHLYKKDIQNLSSEFFYKDYNEAYLTYARYLDNQLECHIDAFQAYQRSSEKKYIPGQIALGLAYFNGNGTMKNIYKGLSLLNDAADKGSIEALCNLCKIYYRRMEYETVLKYAKRFGQNNKLCSILSRAFSGVAYFEQKNYRYAVQELFNEELQQVIIHKENSDLYYYNEGVNFVADHILYAIGNIYANGLGSVTPNFKKALYYYNELAEMDPSWGNGAIGDLFFINEIFKEQTDSELAYRHYLIGANNGSSYCAYRLALMNYYGVGTIPNKTKANEYKKIAIDGGFSVSDFNF